jgi:hypothetical protein
MCCCAGGFGGWVAPKRTESPPTRVSARGRGEFSGGVCGLQWGHQICRLSSQIPFGSSSPFTPRGRQQPNHQITSAARFRSHRLRCAAPRSPEQPGHTASLVVAQGPRSRREASVPLPLLVNNASSAGRGRGRAGRKAALAPPVPLGTLQRAGPGSRQTAQRAAAGCPGRPQGRPRPHSESELPAPARSAPLPPGALLPEPAPTAAACSSSAPSKTKRMPSFLSSRRAPVGDPARLTP